MRGALIKWMQESKQFFFAKKNQKTFFESGSVV
jgi:hypothetical protein